MKPNKLFLSGLTFAVLASLMACSAGKNPITVTAADSNTIKPGALDPFTNSFFAADLGKGQKGADISINMNLGNLAFKTKATANGVTKFNVGNIKKIRLFLTTVSGSALPANILTGSDVTLSPASFSPAWATGTAKAFTFKNITTPGTYFAGVDLQDAGGLTLLDPVVHSGGLVFSPTSKVVDAAFAVTPAATSLTVAATLRNEVGAQIGVDVTATNGTSAGAVTVTEG